MRLLPLVLAALALLPACTTTHVALPVSDAAAIARAERHLEGRTVRVTTLEGVEQRGRLVALRPDSTVWLRNGVRTAVPTRAVATLWASNRTPTALVGAALGLALGIGSVVAAGGGTGSLVASTLVPSLAVGGGVLGATAGYTYRYQLAAADSSALAPAEVAGAAD